MVIYGEYLFLENFITGMVITHFTGKVTGYKTTKLRLFLCGICCGVYAFTIFTGLSGIASAASKTGFAVLISLLAFYRAGNVALTPVLTKALRGAACFLLVTFFYGGIALALLQTMSWQGITAAGGVYMEAPTYVRVTGAAAAAALMIEFTVNLIRTKRTQEKTQTEVTLRIGQREWQAEGFIDSGNFLKEPLSGKPVAVVNHRLFEIIKNESENDPKRYAVIPYSSVGVTKGILEGYRLDELKAGDAVIRNAFLAVWGEEHEAQPEILLPEALIEKIEGGIYAELD